LRLQVRSGYLLAVPAQGRGPSHAYLPAGTVPLDRRAPR